FKEHSARNFVFLSSAAFSAAEKRDYQPFFSNSSTTFLTTSLRRLRFNFVCAEVIKTDINSTASFFLPALRFR
ncbi:hypothetical protein, partial [Burkholderia lata]|uniref:hypothetical protein n=1 Tax=Burkholderia lata (strain ATCC 17760 / DSM 23089 / LMG 22485 / NCIMB 9086 / R18194 / 383) TaxID=482957 RepID=UPI001C2ECD25